MIHDYSEIKDPKAATTRMEALRGAARRATLTFLDKAPVRGHGRVPLEDGAHLSYRRVEREYGLYVEYANGTVVALDKAKDQSLIDGCMQLRALYKVVCDNAEQDALRAEEALSEALSFTESFD